MAEDRPSEADWDERGAWFEQTMAAARGRQAVEIGDHATALAIELETVFCAGAWVATVILAAATVEAHLRERMASAGHPVSPYLNAGDLMLDAGLPEAFDWLRRHRNALLHPGARPYLTPDMHWFQADELEADARRAVELTAAALYGGNGSPAPAGWGETP